MVKIRLRRVGKKKQPSYRIVVADSRAPRDGRFIEIIGFYNPRTEPETVQIKEDRALYWLSVGAQPTEAVERLLRKLGTLDRFARLKAGEPLEALLAEAEAAASAQPSEQPARAQEEAEAPREEASAEEVVSADASDQGEEEAEV
ncbi:MAG TPA: 30S ribosomal protein S16 [Thermoflexia bacterium]|jgi:small subunit ribosomal protein S16|nr:30S ribosomal protein S16 [Thermoflexia bacterium]